MLFSGRSLASLLLVALSAVDAHDSRKPLLITARMGTAGFKSIVASDKARINAMKQGGANGKRSTLDAPVGEVSFACFTTNVSIGNPSTMYTLIVDTGSSNTWVGAQSSHPYTHTKNSVDTGTGVEYQYGSRFFSGEEYLDTLTFSSGLSVQHQGIGAASNSYGFKAVDGVLGLGPVNLTSLSNFDGTRIPTVTDNLYSQGQIPHDQFGIYFVPSNAKSTGELTFGDVDTSKTTSEVDYTPLTQVYPSSNYWGIDLSVAYGGNTILSTSPGVVDSGTTLLLIPSDAFTTYKAATGGVIDADTGLLKITNDQYAKLKDLTFTINSRTYDLTPNGQIWPRSLNAYVKGSSDSIYLIVADGGPSGRGLDFILGFAFLQRYYTVYDTANKHLGIASTQYTDAVSN